MGNIILLLIFEIILFFFAFIFSNRDIIAPSVMMCAMFIISTVFAVININNWTIDYSIETFQIIISGIFVFIIAENLTKIFIGKTKFIQRIDSDENPIHYDDVRIEIPNYFLIGLVILNLLTIAWYYTEIRRITSSLGLTGSIFAAYRRFYGGLAIASESADVEMVNTLLSQLLKITKGAGFICLYSLMMEIVSSDDGILRVLWRYQLLMVNVVLSVLPSLMLAGRNDLMQMIAAVMVYYYIIWHQFNGWDKNISWKYIKWGFVIILLGIPAFYGMLFLLGRTTTRTMFEYASIYIGSSIALLNDYIANPVEAPRVFGEESLLGVHQILYRLGFPTFVKNRHLEYRKLNSVMVSNIYTFFRRPLHDFGLAGMYVFTAFVACFFAYLYYGKIKGYCANPKKHSLIIIYGYLYFWIIYTSIDQRSISMISVSTLLTFAIIFFELFFVSHFRFSIRK
ncbi:MAG: oligosaccharide repeat unit polymerase [Butyrivibrio sp.]|nr:oligosaccharide repeat unit polymerase [Butyrivibrio sp.]